MPPPKFVAEPDPSTFRRIAAAMWGRPSDPSIYGSMDLDATTLLAFIADFRARTGKRLTVTHLVTAAVARAFARHPQLNAKVRFGGRIERRDGVDLTVSVSSDGGRDLSSARIESAEHLDLEDLVGAVENGARRVRANDDDTSKSRNTLRALPFFLLGPALRLTDFITNEANLHLPKLGMPADPLGTAVISNVGGFGVDTAFAPFVPLGRCAMILLISEIQMRPWVASDRVEPRPVLRLCATFDHRLIDGHGAGLIARAIREHLASLEIPTCQRSTTSSLSTATA